jgi:hypothetical protein
MSGPELEHGYWHAYRQFYTWRNLARGAAAHGSLVPGLRHFAYASGWKKFEPLWDVMIRARQAGAMLPVLESILSEFGKRPASERRGEASGSPAAVRGHGSADPPQREPRIIPLAVTSSALNRFTRGSSNAWRGGSS